MKRCVGRSLVPVAGFGPASVLWLALAALTPMGPAAADETATGKEPRLAGEFASGYTLRLGADAARQGKAEADVRAARAAFLPKATLGAEWVLAGQIKYHPQSVVDDDPDLYSDQEPSFVGIETSLTIFDGAKRLNVLRAVTSMEAAGRDATLDLKQRLYLESATAALVVVRDRAVVAIRRADLARQRRTLQITRQMLVDATVTRTDVALAAVRVEATAAALDRARGELAQSEIAYTKLIGRSPEPRLSPRIAASRLPRSAEEAAIRAEEGAPAPRAARAFATAAGFAVDAARSASSPTIEIVGRAAARFDPSPIIDQVDVYTALLRLRMPLFDPTIRPAIDVAAAQASERRYEAETARLEAATAARSSFAGRQAALAEGAALQRRIARAREAVTGMQIEQDLGIRTVGDVLDAQQGLAEAEVLAAYLAYERDRTGFALLAAMGELGEDDGPSPSIVTASRGNF